jgi:hypothetical protein
MEKTLFRDLVDEKSIAGARIRVGAGLQVEGLQVQVGSGGFLSCVGIDDPGGCQGCLVLPDHWVSNDTTRRTGAACDMFRP